MGDAETATIRVANAVADVPATDWDACARGGEPITERPSNPFISHAFLLAIEQSGSASPATGWYPQHLLLDDGKGGTAACMPCYLKTHSRGEYVFDQGWADALERAGGRYYPKLQSAVPFTPVTGRRLLVRDGKGRDAERLLLRAGAQLVEQSGASSLHLTFLTEQEWRLTGELGLLKRTDQQFHWRNENYASFDNFLDRLASRKRKAIRRERREALSPGIDIEWVTGSDLTEAHWDAFFGFYIDTGARKWGSPYLNREFFSLVGASMKDDILLVLAKRDGNYIAGALNFIGKDTLFGRYWGAIEEHAYLHFEICYYQAIDFAIAHGLTVVEAGAQGEHKLARGYLPTTTYSAHLIAHAGLRHAVADYLKRERRAVAQEAALLNTDSPFRRD
jgi:predicted N-acyltransferase